MASHCLGTPGGIQEIVFLDGEGQILASLNNPAYPTNDNLSIGAYDNSNGSGVITQHCDAQIDEVRIWNVARTQAQIRDNMCRQLTGAETGLVSYWNMNEGTGNTVNDLTTNNNHGTRQ